MISLDCIQSKKNKTKQFPVMQNTTCTAYPVKYGAESMIWTDEPDVIQHCSLTESAQ